MKNEQKNCWRFVSTSFRNGLENTGMQKLADACNVTKAGLIYYFGSKDNLVVEATAYCMAKVEDDFMAKAPTTHCLKMKNI